MQNAKKVFVNTLFLYGKSIFTLVFAIISTRVVLSALGTEDFGLFNLLAGIILMLSFLNGAMTVTTQRFLSFYIGKGEANKSKDLFRTSIAMHIIIGGIVVILLESIRLYLFNSLINIPSNRIYHAEILYQFMIISTFITISAVPFDSVINAHEDMLFDSIVGVIESFLKMCIAFFLISTIFDKLIVYGILIASLTILIRIVKTIWCVTRYEECNISFRLSVNTTLFKEMFSYSLWNLFGALCYVAKSQGIAIILNRFFGVSINATYAIANQVNSQMQSFSAMMVKAFNPQIVKSEGGGDRLKMLKLAAQSSKFSVFLMIFLLIPLLIEMPYILKLWLVKIPEYSVAFCSIILVSSVISQMSTGLKSAIQASGVIKVYQAVVGTTMLLNLPVAYLLLHFKFPVYYVIIASLIIEFCSLIIRLFIVSKYTGLSKQLFLNEIIIKGFTIAILSYVIASIPLSFMDQSLQRLLIVVIISIFCTLILTWKFGFTKDERYTMIGILKSFTSRFVN